MNFIDSTIFSLVFSALLLIFLLARDIYHHKTLKEKITNTSKKIGAILKHRRYPFLGKKEIWAKIIIIVLSLGICLSLYARFIEVYWLKTTQPKYDFPTINEPIKIIWLSDLQVGNHKKESWLEKIITQIERGDPDLIILGGDIIDNEGSFIDETIYLEPLRQISQKYKMYYIMGNHEYGIGDGAKDNSSRRTANRSQEVKVKMADLGIVLLQNNLTCPTIKQQKICLFGLDEIWEVEPDFDELKNWNQTYPLIMLTHNPDGVLSWPKELPYPQLTLAGHTHGGQVWLPGYGPLGYAGIILGKDYYRGAKKYEGADIYISIGAGESGGAVRFGARPELTSLTIE